MSIPTCMEKYNCKSCKESCPNFDIRTAKYLPEDKWPTKWTVAKFNTCYKCGRFGKDCPNKPSEPNPEPPHRSERDLQMPISRANIQPLKWSILDRMKECIEKDCSAELLNYTNAFDILNRTYPDFVRISLCDTDKEGEQG